MTLESIQVWIEQNPTLAPWVLGAAMLIMSVLVFVIARYLIARGLVALAKRTENRYDDIIVNKLRPFRFAWIAPLAVIFVLAGLLPEGTEAVRQVVLFLTLWLVIFTVNSLLSAANAIYESSHFYRGDSIQVYIDLVKILLIVVAIILSISMLTGRSPLVLLSGLGAMMAILLLVFRDTILSFVAGIQILSNDLVNEGDWIEVPSYGADGTVLNISLHSVRVQNGDKTITVVPTYKLVDVPYKNWRGMEESGGRRIKRAVHIDITSIKFCTEEMLDQLKQYDQIRDYVETLKRELELGESERDGATGASIDTRWFTNLDAYRTYATDYLRSRDDLHQEEMKLLFRQLSPGPDGLPLEVYAFTKTTEWYEYENIQADIMSHLLAAVPLFNLRVFQQPVGRDFRALARSR